MGVWNKKFKVADSLTSIDELVREVCLNFLWGFIGNSIIVFMARGIDYAVAVNFVLYYLLMSYVVNRDKYTTRFGKYVLMPITASTGAFLGYKFAQIMSTII